MARAPVVWRVERRRRGKIQSWTFTDRADAWAVWRAGSDSLRRGRLYLYEGDRLVIWLKASDNGFPDEEAEKGDRNVRASVPAGSSQSR